MDTNVVKIPIQASHVFPSVTRITKLMKTDRVLVPLACYPRKKNIRIGEFPSGFRPIYITRTAERSLVWNEEENEEKEKELKNCVALAQVKTDFYQAVRGMDRGIFGVPSTKKSEIDELVKLLESRNPTPYPTSDLKKVDGSWKLVYTTIAMKAKLALRHFISLGDIFQTIDVGRGKTINSTVFSLRGLNLLKGKLIIEASFRIASKSRVDLSYDNSMIYPDQLMKLLRKNYDHVLRMFKREAWFEITYVDDTMMIGKDDRGNTYILERSQQNMS